MATKKKLLERKWIASNSTWKQYHKEHLCKRKKKTQENSQSVSYGDIDEKIIYIIRECGILAQEKYKCRNDWVWKVFYWELSKKFKFVHNTKWYMHKPESVLENETH